MNLGLWVRIAHLILCTSSTYVQPTTRISPSSGLWAVRGQLLCNLIRWWMSSMVIWSGCTICLLKEKERRWATAPAKAAIIYLGRFAFWWVVRVRGQRQTRRRWWTVGGNNNVAWKCWHRVADLTQRTIYLHPAWRADGQDPLNIRRCHLSRRSIWLILTKTLQRGTEQC